MSDATAWTHEKGPRCLCGMPTGVQFIEGGNGLPVLICIFHTGPAGAIFPLPKDRPSNWPDLSDEEMRELIERGEREHEAADGAD